MTSIVSSTYTEGPVQVDGRRYVTETHTDDKGAQYSYQWLGAQDAAAVLHARATALNSQLAAQDAAAAVIVGTLLPMSKLDFRGLFTDAEKQLIDELNATYASNASLSVATQRAIRTGLEDFDKATGINKPFLPAVQQMLALYQALGLLTAERVTAILAAGNS